MMINKKIFFGRVVVYLALLVLLMFTLPFIYYETEFGHFLSKTYQCSINDNEAIKIAKDYCGEFDLTCTGKPEVKYYETSGLAVSKDSWIYRKFVSFDSTKIHINCENSKVSKLVTYTEGSKLISESTFIEAIGIFNEMLRKSDFKHCYLINKYYSDQKGGYNLGIYAFNDDGSLRNYGSFGYNQQTKLMSYEIMGRLWCDRQVLPTPFNKIIHIDDAKIIGEKYINNQLEREGYEPSTFKLDKVTLDDEYHMINNQTWHIGFQNIKSRVVELSEEDKNRFKLGTVKEDYLAKERPGDSPGYITIVINAITGELIERNYEGTK